MPVAAEALRHWLAAQNLESWAVGGNGEGEDKVRIGTPHKRGREGDIGLMGNRRGGGELFGAVHEDPVRGFFDYVQGDFFFVRAALLILRLLAAVHLRVAQGVGQKEIVFHTVAVIVDHVGAKVAVVAGHGTEFIANIVEGDDVGRQNIRSAELAPALLVPDFAVASLAFEIVVVARQEPRDTAAVTSFLGDKGHLVPVGLGVLEVVDAGEFVHHAAKRRVGGNVIDFLAIEPDVAAVFEALDIAGTGHGTQRGCGVQRHDGSPVCEWGIHRHIVAP